MKTTILEDYQGNVTHWKKPKYELTHKEIASLGGQARWKGISKKRRSELMRKVVMSKGKNVKQSGE